MFDVFTQEIEVTIKDGIANLYWYKDDLKKAWLRSGTDSLLCNELFNRRNTEGTTLTKRQLMNLLYEKLREADYNKRLEISRNFVRILVEHKNFAPQDPRHRIDVAEKCALRLKAIIAEQEKDRESRPQINRASVQVPKLSYEVQLAELKEKFLIANAMEGPPRGYEFERLFTELMKISGIPVEKPFRIVGEQIDGAIKHDGHFYLVELKWVKAKSNQADIASLYLKVEGKLDARGIFIAMEGYSQEVLESLPRGKEIKVLLLNGVHLFNVIYGTYNFQELLEHAVSFASLRGDIHCPINISG